MFTSNGHSTQREQSEQFSSSDEEVNHRFRWSRFRRENSILTDLSSGGIVSSITVRWKDVKNRAGYTPDKNVYSVIIGDRILEGIELPNAINEALVDVNKLMPPISDLDKVSGEQPRGLYIPVASVQRRLEEVKSFKAPGPDSIPNWLLKQFSMELATPVASIFNASISQALVFLQWKVADITPIPKTNAVEDLNNDFRPISLTATLSKILESFYAEWTLESIYHKLDPRQFGSLAGSSSVDALISLLHSLYADTDGNGKTMRVFLLDFSKAFDRINYKILISKMRKLDINESITKWVIDFLSGRKQGVKISGGFGRVASQWRCTPRKGTWPYSFFNYGKRSSRRPR